MITEEQIQEQAKQESIRKVTDYSPTSYRAGFVDACHWILKRNEKISVKSLHVTKKSYLCSAKSNPDGESSTRPFALQVGLF